MKGEGRQRKIKGTFYVIKVRTFSLHLQKSTAGLTDHLKCNKEVPAHPIVKAEPSKKSTHVCTVQTQVHTDEDAFR